MWSEQQAAIHQSDKSSGLTLAGLLASASTSPLIDSDAVSDRRVVSRSIPSAVRRPVPFLSPDSRGSGRRRGTYCLSLGPA